MQEAIGVMSEAQETLTTPVARWPAYKKDEGEQRLDFFIERDGQRYAGTHLIIDLKGASHLDNLEVMENALRDAVVAAKATLLHIHLHHFTPNGGISGVAVLAESHISVHTWPERNYAAFDVFMCGDAEPANTLPVLEAAFSPAEVLVSEILRGTVSVESDDSVR
ncbi:adenosylmethionine decarboxylase [Nitrincola sp. MINF-07-Sa-05]|uniref:adenosylmethionine decarboxylase n=1 Tax=Nitrincola salilacus TaxID=3400273 RepID=UPI003918236C